MQNIQNPDPSIEAGKFIGSFFVTTIHEAISKITQRDNKSEHEIVASLADWEPIIAQLDYFKFIHNFAQEFLDHVSDRLFGVSTNGQTLSSKTDLLSLQKIWKKSYGNEYSNDISELRNRTAHFQQAAEEHVKAQISSNYHLKHIDNNTKNCILHLGKGVPEIHIDLANFMNDLEKMANKAINLSMPASEVQDIDSWRSAIDPLAKIILGKADSILIKLINILSFLYTMTMIKKK